MTRMKKKATRHLPDFSWDRNASEEVRVFRQMLWGDPREVYETYGPKKLVKIFLIHGHKADRRNFNFWKMILDIQDKDLEVNRNPEKSLRTNCKIWDY